MLAWASLWTTPSPRAGVGTHLTTIGLGEVIHVLNSEGCSHTLSLPAPFIGGLAEVDSVPSVREHSNGPILTVAPVHGGFTSSAFHSELEALICFTGIPFMCQ